MEHEDDVNVVALSPDRWWVASGSGNNQERTLTGHVDRVRAVAVTPDGCLAISASNDRTLKIWDLQTGQELATVALEGVLMRIALALDGVTILAGDRAGNVYCLCYVEDGG